MRVASIVLVSTLFLMGCGGSETSTTAAPLGAPSTRLVTNSSGVFDLRTPRLTGTVDMQGARSANVEVVTVGSARRLQATLDNGQVLRADTDERWIWVTAATTVLAAYRDAHPEATRAEGLQKVKAYLGIAAGESLDRPFLSVPASRFSPRAFEQAAAAAGLSLPAYAATLVPAIDAGSVHLYVEPARERIAALSLVGAGTELLSNIWGGGLALSVTAKGAGFICGLCGIHNATYKQLSAISSQLNQVSSQLDGIQSQLDKLTSQAAVHDLKTYVGPSIANVTAFTNQQMMANLAMLPQTNGSASSYFPFSLNPGSFEDSNSPFSTLLGLLNQSDALTYAFTILQAALGMGNNVNGNLCMGYAELVTQRYGFGVDQYNGTVWPFFYDFRTDTVTPSVANATDYYGRQVLLAANMLSESANVQIASGSQSPYTSLTEGQQSLNGYELGQTVGGGFGPKFSNGLAALSKRLLQQSPLGLLGGQSPLGNTLWAAVADPETVAGTGPPGLSNGTLWAAQGFYTTDSGSGNSDSPNVDIVSRYSINGWDQWYYPNETEVQLLMQRAYTAASNSPKPPSDTSNYVAFGLWQLGLITEDAYNYASNNKGYVEVYCNFSQSTGGQEGLHLYVYRSDGNLYDTGLSTITDADPPFVALAPQNNTLAVLLMVRPFPGLPLGSQAATSAIPSSVSASQTAQRLSQWNSDSSGGNNKSAPLFENKLPLAGNLIPDEIVLQQDPSNLGQMKAYALWMVGLQNPPANYGLSSWSVDGTQYSMGYGSAPFASYAYYADVTDLVEWLSSDSSIIEVLNYAPAATTLVGAQISNLSGNVSLFQSTNSTAVAGATILAGEVTQGTVVSAGNTLYGSGFSGALPASSPLPLSAGTLSAGQLTGTTTNTLFTPAGEPAGFITNGTISGANVNGVFISLPPSQTGGSLVVHSQSTPVKITGSWMYSPNTTATPAAGPNSQDSLAQYIPPAPGASPFQSFGENPYQPSRVPGFSQLGSLFIGPNYAEILSAPDNEILFYLTGINLDGTYQSLETSTNTSFQVFLLGGAPGLPTPSPAPSLAFNTAGQTDTNVLNVPSAFKGNIAVKAANSNLTAWSFLNLSF